MSLYSDFLTCFTAVVMGVTLLVFGVMFVEDRNWLPNPHFNYLSWSYGLAICSCFFQIFATIAQVYIYIYCVGVKGERKMRRPKLCPYFGQYERCRVSFNIATSDWGSYDVAILQLNCFNAGEERRVQRESNRL